MTIPRAVLLLGDWLAFPGFVPAAVAGGLLLAATAALGSPPNWVVAGLATTGTLVVYNVDRLRDTAADRASAPLRTAFVEGHRRGLWLLTLVSLASSLALAAGSAREVQLLCAAVLALGLLHRRLKRWPRSKLFHVGAAWLAVTVGIPALGARDPSALPWVLAVFACAIGANLVATSLRTDERRGGGDRGGHPLRTARAAASLGVVVGLLGPAPVHGLAAIPACELLALACFRPGERYGLVVVDGALLVGAAIVLALDP
jgi:hypothetical protein